MPVGPPPCVLFAPQSDMLALRDSAPSMINAAMYPYAIPPTIPAHLPPSPHLASGLSLPPQLILGEQFFVSASTDDTLKNPSPAALGTRPSVHHASDDVSSDATSVSSGFSSAPCDRLAPAIPRHDSDPWEIGSDGGTYVSPFTGLQRLGEPSVW